MFMFLFLFFSMLLLFSFFRLKELFQVKNGVTTSLLFLFENAKNLCRSDDGRRRKKNRMAWDAKLCNTPRYLKCSLVWDASMSSIYSNENHFKFYRIKFNCGLEKGFCSGYLDGRKVVGLKVKNLPFSLEFQPCTEMNPAWVTVRVVTYFFNFFPLGYFTKYVSGW